MRLGRERDTARPDRAAAALRCLCKRAPRPSQGGGFQLPPGRARCSPRQAGSDRSALSIESQTSGTAFAPARPAALALRPLAARPALRPTRRPAPGRHRLPSPARCLDPGLRRQPSESLELSCAGAASRGIPARRGTRRGRMQFGGQRPEGREPAPRPGPGGLAQFARPMARPARSRPAWRIRRCSPRLPSRCTTESGWSGRCSEQTRAVSRCRAQIATPTMRASSGIVGFP